MSFTTSICQFCKKHKILIDFLDTSTNKYILEDIHMFYFVIIIVMPAAK